MERVNPENHFKKEKKTSLLSVFRVYYCHCAICVSAKL